MKKYIVLSIVLALALATISIAPTPIAHTEDDPQVVTLWAGQNIDAGTVSVWNDGENIYVTFETTGGWEMTETHLYVGKTDPNDLTSAPGQFPYCSPHDPPETTVPYVIALADIDSYSLELNKKGKATGKWIADGDPGVGIDDMVYIAAHASLSDEDTMILVSEPGIDVYGPLTTYASVDDSAWGTANPAVATWVHSAWPSISGATWISNTYYIGAPIAASSWRWFHEEFSLPDSSNLISATLSVTSDNAEDFYLNGVLIGSDGEVQGAYVDDHEWGTILTYGIDPQAGLNKLDFIVRNYPGSSSPTSNPTGLIYKAEICYATGETAWGEGTNFGTNWAMYFTYTVQEMTCPCILDYSSDNIEVLDYIPDDIRVGQFENDDYIRVWKEFEGTLTDDLYYDLDEGLSARTDGPPAVDPYIPAGTQVCIYYVHLDNVGPSSTVQQTGQITFGANILGLIISGGNLGTFTGRDLMFAADNQIGYSGTTYPTTSGVDYWRGFDVNYGGNLDDAVFTGPTVDFTMWVVNAHDSFRVILPLV